MITRTDRRTRRGLLAVVVGMALTLTLLSVPARADRGDLYYAPPSSPTQPGFPEEVASYPRVVRLQHGGSANGTLVATSEAFFTAPNGFRIRRSTDNGQTWTQTAFVTGGGAQFPLTWHPTLFEVPQATGGLAAGTLLLAGAAFPPNDPAPLPHSIEVYKSTDAGLTWSHVSTPVSAPESVPGVWEPDFELDQQGRLVMYYASEQGFTNGGQSLNYVVSTTGGQTWSAPVVAIGATSSPLRPGMPTVTRVGSTWIMNIEGYCAAGTAPQCRAASRNFVKTSPDGVTWGDPYDWGSPIETADGRYLAGTPYTTWTPAGGPNGTLLAQGHEAFVQGQESTLLPETGKVLFANYELGAGPWYQVSSPLTFTGTRLGSPDTYCVGWSGGMVTMQNPSQVLQMVPTEFETGQCEIRYATANVGVLPFADYFTDGRDQGWAAFRGSWSVAGGVYANASTTGRGDVTTAGSTAWRDYRMSTDIRLEPGGGNAGVVVRASNTETGFDGGRGYVVSMVENGDLFVGRKDGGFTLLGAQAPTSSFQAGTWYRLSVEVVGCTIEAQARTTAGVVLSTVTVSDPGCTATRLGQVGLRTDENAAAYRSVTVQEVTRTEAEDATRTGQAQVYASTGSSNGAHVGRIDDASSGVTFRELWVPRAGRYSLTVAYANGGAAATHALTVNGQAAGSVAYAPTAGWAQFGRTSVEVDLAAGSNTVRLSKGQNFAELDYVLVEPRYEAERGSRTGAAQVRTATGASAGAFVGGIDTSNESVTLTGVRVPAAGTYTVRVRYANGGSAATHQVRVNGASTATTVSYPPTAGWGQFGSTTVQLTLAAGSNTLRFARGTGFAELDAVDVVTGGSAPPAP